MVFRVKLLTLTMTGIMLVGLIPLAVTGLRRGQLRSEMMEELNALGRSECAKVANDIYIMLRAQNEKLKKEVRHDLNVAGYVMEENGGVSIGQKRVHWTAKNQSSGGTIQIELNEVLIGGKWIDKNENPAISSPVVDKVRELVGARCTIFQKMNDAGDLLRVCTNVLKKDGTRAIGMYIPAVEPDGTPNQVVATVLQGKTYVGRAYVVDDWYLTAYEPIFDAKEKVIGAIFCGVRLEDIPELRKGIVEITVGRTGYAYILGGSGEQRGRYIISHRGLRDGENIYDSKDAVGNFFIRSIIDEALQTKDGKCNFTNYEWQNPGEETPRRKVVAVTYFEPWDWVIGAGAYEDDFQDAITRVDQAASRLMFWGAIGIFMAFGLCGMLAWVESGRIAAMNHEIAERKRAEEAIRVSEVKYKTLFDSSSDALMYTIPDGKMLAGNSATLKLFGYKGESEFISKSPADFSPEYQPDGTLSSVKAQQMLALAMARGENFFEWTHKRVNGEEFFATVLLTRMELEGRPVLLASVRDITAQKTAEQALRESERRLAAIIDFLPDATFAIDRQGKVIAWNRAIEDMTGIPAEDMIGKGEHAYAIPFYGEARPVLIDLVFKDDKEVERRYESVTRKGIQLVAESSSSKLHKDKVTYLWITAAPLYDSSGRLAGAIESVRDISERKIAEANLAQAHDAAQAANRAKSQFLATMSHEIRTPMTAILGYADLLMDPAIDASTRHNYAVTIRRSGEHLLSIINDILDLSKIEAGKMSLNMGQCQLVSLLADVASLLRPRANQHGISFSIEYTGIIPETIISDNARLRQAILNLTGNAVKFTEKGSVRIVVTFLPDGLDGRPAVQIAVIDTGIGMNNDVLPKLFRPFTQGDASVSRKYGGTGLGLAISHHIAHLLGGNLTANSELEHGSTFALTIPTGDLDGVAMLKNPAEVMSRETEVRWSSESVNLTGLRILLAEDGFDNRMLITTILRRAGANVEAAENGRIAVEKALESPFDMILMDMNMPEMDGYEATRVLREEGYGGPILALTANAMAGDREQCKAAGCDEYMAKPINRELLIRTIASMVEFQVRATI